MDTRLTQAIELNPYAVRPWRLWLEILGDADGSVLKASEALGLLGLSDHRDALLDQDRQSLSWATPEDCLQSCETLQARAAALGISFDAERAQIQARAQQMDEARRTFKGTLYATPAEAVAAREAAEDVSKRTIAGVTYDTHEQATLANTAWLEEQARTFRGVKYATPKSAQDARWRHHRATSLAFWVGVVFAPFPTALLTLRPGFQTRQRIVAFLWLCVVVAFLGLFGAFQSWQAAVPLTALAMTFAIMAWLASLAETWARIAILDTMRSNAEDRGEVGSLSPPFVTPN